MTDDEKLVILQRLTGEENVELLSTYLSVAKEVVLSYAFPFNDGSIDEVPPKYDMIQIEIAEYKYHKRGAEGERVHSENGVSVTWENSGVPRSMLRQITPMAGVL